MMEMTNISKVIAELEKRGYQAKEVTKMKDGRNKIGVSIVKSGPSPAIFADERDIFFTSTENVILTLITALNNAPDVPDNIGEFEYWKKHCFLTLEKIPEETPRDFDPLSKLCPIPGYMCCVGVEVPNGGHFIIHKQLLMDRTFKEIEELWELAAKRTYEEVTITKGADFDSGTIYEAASDTVQAFAALCDPKPLADICKKESVDRIAVIPCSYSSMLFIPVRNDMDIAYAEIFWKTQLLEPFGGGVYVYELNENRYGLVTY